MRDVQLEVPARAEYVSLVRMVISSLVASRRDVEGELLDDLALAVSEACALATLSGAQSMRVVCHEEDDAVVVEVGEVQPGVESHADIPDPFQLMRALVDDVDIDAGCVKLRLLCPPAPAAA